MITITENLEVLPFNGQMAVKASQIYHSLRRSNQMIEFRDIFLAHKLVELEQQLT